MKNLSTILNTILIGVLIIILLAFGLPEAQVSPVEASAQSTSRNQSEPEPGCDPRRSLQVSGTAVVNVIPDRALIQLGVQSNATTTAAVEAANTEAIANIRRAIQALGVEPKDIATDRYVIEPVYDSYDSLYIKGYRINNIVGITLRDVDLASRVIAEALDAGANQVVNVEFYTSELRKYRDQARELAIKAAGEKAQALAGAAGSQTGCVLTIHENTWSYYNGWYGGRDRNLWTQNVVQNAAPSGGSQGSSSEGEPVSLGQISVRAEVGVSYALK